MRYNPRRPSLISEPFLAVCVLPCSEPGGLPLNPASSFNPIDHACRNLTHPLIPVQIAPVPLPELPPLICRPQSRTVCRQGAGWRQSPPDINGCEFLWHSCNIRATASSTSLPLDNKAKAPTPNLSLNSDPQLERRPFCAVCKSEL